MLIVAGACLLILLYTYAGYPVLITVLARLRPLRVTADPDYTPMVSVCTAVHNGMAYLDTKIESLLAMDWPVDKLEILIYSDGSTDGTVARVKEWSARDPRVRLVEGAVRAGKPTGLNLMRAAAVGEVLFMTDVRQKLNQQALRVLCARLADPRVGCVTGNLVLEGSAGSGAYWRYEKFIRQQEARFRSVVGMTGAIAVARKADVADLPPALILDDVWIPMRLRLQNRLILFAEEAHAYDVAFEDDREFGRKVRTLAGNFQLFAWMPALLSPLHNPSWLETVSHKLLRLVCPFALLALLASSMAAFFASPIIWICAAGAALLGGQMLFYAGAVAGARAGKLGSLARTFVVMNAAALVGCWRFLTGGQRVTW